MPGGSKSRHNYAPMPMTGTSSLHTNFTQPTYIGRFAPSPTGPLHFGSLVSALASYLDAKANHGQWLVRMEDLDPPREQSGAATEILRSLEAHGLYWDGDILYQSQRLGIYQEQLEALIRAGLVYPCQCPRQRLQSLGGVYDGHCRQHPADLSQAIAWRLKLYDLPSGFALPEIVRFTDAIQGEQSQNLRTQAGDQILKRRDGFYAYPLAVVVDDIAQGITHIIRGSDLLEVTGRQIFFFYLLGKTAPTFGHVPLAIQENGQKLSKQNHAPALLANEATRNLWQALRFLGQNPPSDLIGSQPTELLAWGLAHWQLGKVQGLSHLYSE
jgi:glutamyl-Q tRNA(Asp) synthetase